jgi:uncharacterized caspase-like protein
VSDATGFAKELQDEFGYQLAVPPITEKLATRKTIESLVTDELPRILKPDDDLIIFFAGHGTTRTSEVNGEKSKTGYLVPVEAHAPGEDEHFSDYIKVDEFLRNIADLPARHILVILDSCYSGLALGSSFRPPGRGDGRYEAAMAGKTSRTVITSASEDETAADTGPVPDHSLFTGVLIEGLKEDRADTSRTGFVTGSQLGLFVSQKVGDADGSTQTPRYGSFYRDANGELSLRRPPPGEAIVLKAPAAPMPSAPTTGRYYALVIGINRYSPPLHPLRTAVNDAQSIARELNEQYGFQVRLLLDETATRANILRTLVDYRNTLHSNDNLLIYFGGEGYFDRDADKAYWLPSDTESIDSPNRIIADDLTVAVRVQSARHVLLVSDDAFSGEGAGNLTRGAGPGPEGIADQAYLTRMMNNRSRTIMSAGRGDEPVNDGGTDGHSVFAHVFLKALEQAKESIFTASDLFKIIRQVAQDSDQMPEYSRMRNSNDDDGDFVFVRRAIP